MSNKANLKIFNNQKAYGQTEEKAVTIITLYNECYNNPGV